MSSPKHASEYVKFTRIHFLRHHRVKNSNTIEIVFLKNGYVETMGVGTSIFITWFTVEEGLLTHFVSFKCHRSLSY